MLPNITNRINNLIKSMETTIAPALVNENGLAKEQASLFVGHLKMLSQQWDKAYLFEKGSLDAMINFAEKLLEHANGDSKTNSATIKLKSTLSSVPKELPHTADAVNQYTISIGNSIDSLINACYYDGTETFRKQLFDITIDYGTKQSYRERVWFNETGLDPDKEKLVSIDEMLAM